MTRIKRKEIRSIRLIRVQNHPLPKITETTLRDRYEGELDSANQLHIPDYQFTINFKVAILKN
jgi:hypothetical protein